jgi:hypothetical protein
VHVPGARDHELAFRVNDARRLRDPGSGRGHHLDDALARDPYHLVADQPPFDDVDDRHVSEGDVVRAGGRCEEQQSQSEGSGEISHLIYLPHAHCKSNH